MDTQDHEHVDTGRALDAFWDGFSLYPSAWQTALYSSPPLLAGIASIPFLLYVAVAAAADVALGHPGMLWMGHNLREWQEIAATAGVILIMWAFSRLSAAIPGTLRWLYAGGALSTVSGDVGESWLGYLNDYKAALHRRVGLYSATPVLLVFVLIFNRMVGIPESVAKTLSGGTALYTFSAVMSIILWMFGFSLWALLAGLIIWPILVTSAYLVKLVRRFDLVVLPSHPDRCGGLARLGSLAFSLALPIAVAGVFLAAFGLSPALWPNLRIGEVSVDQIRSESAQFSNFGLFAVALPIVAWAFLRPVWCVHRRMVASRERSWDAYGRIAAGLLAQLDAAIARPDGVLEAHSLRERLDLHQASYPSQETYPVWPIRLPTLLTLLLPQIARLVAPAALGVREFLLMLLD